MKVKPSTRILCKECGNSDVLCQYVNKNILISCNKCFKETESGPDAIVIRQLKKIPKNSGWIGVYYGPWNVDEFDILEAAIRDVIRNNQDFNDEWRFYKGRATFAAWRHTWEGGKIISSKTLMSLVDQVERVCNTGFRL